MKSATLTCTFFIAALAANAANAQQEASVDQLKFLKFLVGEWETPTGTSTWEWTLNGRVLSYESYDEAGNHKMSGKAMWDSSQKIIVNRFYTSGGNFYTQTWTQRKNLESAVVVCFPNGKYFFTMRADGENGVIVESPNSEPDRWTRKKVAKADVKADAKADVKSQ